MAYLEQLQAGLRYLGRAGESGRKSSTRWSLR